MARYDLVIRNAAIIDGTGAPPRPGDIGVRRDRIEAVGDVSGDATLEIDARGHVVCPGFIDVHAHDDAAVVRAPAMDFKIMQGVTTDVVGNCGAGVAPANDVFRAYYPVGFGPILGDSDLPWRTTSEYFDAVDRARPACNVTAYIAHGVVRCNTLENERREPEAAELAQMRELVEVGMAAGAIGLWTGLIYPPGRWAQTPEIVELARVAAQHGGIYTSHIRNEGPGLLEAVQEAIAIGEQSGCPVQLSHHKAGSPACFGMTKDSLALIAQARARGLDITLDVYPYVASSSSLAAMVRAGGPGMWEHIPSIIASVKFNKEKYEGRYISDIAAELDLPLDDAVRKILQDEENTPSVTMFTMHEDDVRRVIADEHAMIGSDGLPTEGQPHPRLYGTMARVLEQYVRNEPVVTLEDAVRKMTSLPARKHRVTERGVLEPGWFADVVIFDPQTIADVATYDDPRQYPAGIDCVIVNGEVAARDGKQTGARSGRMLRRGA
ncbi:MAG: D-aminoacylase [Dehalococcoidia bacterium]